MTKPRAAIPILASQIISPSDLLQEDSARFETIREVLAQGERQPAPSAIRSAYLHVPFCFHKCHYCDFYSIVDNQDRQAVFTARLIAELEASREWLAGTVETIFVGGGTPTLLRPMLWRDLLACMRCCLVLQPDGEFTVEANPETVTVELAESLVEGGVNRVSIGCQSFNPSHLKTLERWHDPRSVERAVTTFRAAGIDNINLDLIFGIPGQSLEHWLVDLEAALNLEPSHLSCYGLVYEPNTPLTAKMKAGRIVPAEGELEAQMFQSTIDRLRRAGFEHYEISNWAKAASGRSPGRRCRHNMAYWTDANWWAFGPSASGHVGGTRWKNVPRLTDYLNRGPLPPVTDVERIDEDGRVGEAFMVGLRLIEGLSMTRVESLLAAGPSRSKQRRCAIDRHVESGLLQVADGRLCLTSQGLLLADSVLVDLI